MHVRVFCLWRSECGLVNRFHNNYILVNTFHGYIYPIRKCECQYVSLKLFRLITNLYFLFNLNKQDGFAAVWLSYTDLFNLCLPLQTSCTSYHVLVLLFFFSQWCHHRFRNSGKSAVVQLRNRCVGSLKRLKWTFWLVIATSVRCTPMN